MNITGVTMRRSIIPLVAIFSVLLMTVAPFTAKADELSVQAVQLLPPNSGNTCARPQAPTVKVYTYDNAVNSYDVTMTDSTYVAIAGSVGNTAIPFFFMTRTVDAAGVLHMHVDTPSVRVEGTLPITLTLLSVRADKTVCAVTVTTSVVGATMISGSRTATVGKNVSVHGTERGVGAMPSNINTGSSGAVTSGTANIMNALDKACSTVNGATRLWTVLLAIYLLIVAATILTRPITTKPTDQSTILLGAAIVLPLLLLLAAWGYAQNCRVGLWIPIGALLVAGVGFLIGFRNYPQFSNMLKLPPAPPKSPPPPPPPQKIPPPSHK